MQTAITFDDLGVHLTIYRDVKKAFVSTIADRKVFGMFRRIPGGCLDYVNNPTIPNSVCPAEVLHVLGSMI